MAHARASWLRCSFLLSPSVSRSLYFAQRQYPLPLFLLKRKSVPSIASSFCSSSPPSTSYVASTDAATSTVFHLHNTLTKSKEPFRPKVEGKVGMYVCGITAYDLSHIGHARVSVVFDVLYRYLKHLKYEVIYVRNFTDVDDKIIARANELGEDPLTLSNRYCAEFQSDMALLHCLPPAVEPRVSTHMNQIIDMIQQILVNGFAYSVDGDVYFSVDKYPAYGQLSGRRLQDNQPGQRVAVDSRKQNPADFALWKVIDVYHPLALRLFLIGTHYRSTISYSIAQLEIASDRLYYIYQTICDCDNSLNKFNGENLKDYVPKYIVDCINKFQFDFEKSLADDLHTPIGLASFSEPLKIINDLLHTPKGKKEHMRMDSLMLLGNEIKDGLHILGLKPSSFSEALLQLREKALKRAGLTEEKVLQSIEERSSARKAKLYEKSDVIRKELAAVGITLMDGPDETSWRPAVPLHLQEQLPSAA